MVITILKWCQQGPTLALKRYEYLFWNSPSVLKRKYFGFENDYINLFIIFAFYFCLE